MKDWAYHQSTRGVDLDHSAKKVREIDDAAEQAERDMDAVLDEAGKEVIQNEPLQPTDASGR